MFFEGTEVYDLNPPLTIESPLEDRIRLLIRGTFLFFSYTQLTRREDVTFFVWIINMNEHKNEFHVCACVYVHVSVENKDRCIPHFEPSAESHIPLQGETVTAFDSFFMEECPSLLNRKLSGIGLYITKRSRRV